MTFITFDIFYYVQISYFIILMPTIYNKSEKLESATNQYVLNVP